MTLSELMDKIESSEFEMQLNPIGGFSIFQRRLFESHLFSALVGYLFSDRLNALEVAGRAFEMIPEGQQYDYAVSAYMFALHVTGYRMVGDVIKAVLSVSDCFWSRQMAKWLA